MLLLLPYMIAGLAGALLVCLPAGFKGVWAWAAPVLLFIAFTLAALLLFVLFLGVIALFTKKDKPVEKPVRFYTGLTKYALGLFSAFMGIRIHLKGEELIPDGRYLLVSNHRSIFDPIVTIWALRRQELAFISKPSNMALPIIGKFAYMGCHTAIDREDDRAALKTILASAELMKKDAVSFAVYPEGTRNRGQGLLPFRNGCFKIAQRAKAPIVVMTTEYSGSVKRNFPFRHTDVWLTIRKVIPAEEVCSMKTNELGDMIAGCMLEYIK